MRTVRRFRLAAFVFALLASTGGAALRANRGHRRRPVRHGVRRVAGGRRRRRGDRHEQGDGSRSVAPSASGTAATPSPPCRRVPTRVTVESPGFRHRGCATSRWRSAKPPRANFVLQVGGPTETVTVVGTSPLLDPRRTAVSTVIAPRQIDGLPTNGRDFLSFSVLTPGVNTDRTPYQGAVATSGLTFAGQRARFEQHHRGWSRQQRPYRRRRAGHVQSGSRPGIPGRRQLVLRRVRQGDRWRRQHRDEERYEHGSPGNVFGFFRDDALNARDHFEMFDPAGSPLDQGKSPYSRYQFGGTLGGPIRRERSFFFLSAESLRSQANNFVNIDNTSHIRSSGGTTAPWRQVLERDGFPVALGRLPYRVDSGQVLAKVDTAAGRHTPAGDTLQLGRPAGRERRAVGRQDRAQPRRVAGQPRPDGRRVADVSVLVSYRQRVAIPGRVPQPERRFVRPASAAAPATGRTRAVLHSSSGPSPSAASGSPLSRAPTSGTSWWTS